MTEAQIRDLVERRVSFHNMTFKYRTDFPGYAVLEMAYKTIDSYTLKPTRIVHSVRVAGYLFNEWSEEEVIRWIFHGVREVMVHEAGEFFRVDDRIKYNPHSRG